MSKQPIKRGFFEPVEAFWGCRGPVEVFGRFQNIFGSVWPKNFSTSPKIPQQDLYFVEVFGEKKEQARKNGTETDRERERECKRENENENERDRDNE